MYHMWSMSINAPHQCFANYENIVVIFFINRFILTIDKKAFPREKKKKKRKKKKKSTQYNQFQSFVFLENHKTRVTLSFLTTSSFPYRTFSSKIHGDEMH